MLFLKGLCSMTLYYTKFHPAGPIPCCPLFGDIETSSPPSSKEASESGSKVNTLRSLKHIWTQDRACPLGQTEGVSLKSSPRSDDGCTDKKLLLENWIARSGSPMFASAPISQDPDNSLDDIEFHTVVNSADTSYDKGVVNEGYKCSETFFSETEKTNSERHKRRGICSPTELGLKLAQLSEQCTNLTAENSTLTSQKRRGICSSDQLVLDLSDLNNIDTLTNPDVDVNVNDDVKLKRRPIYSVGSTLNSFNVDLNLKNMYSVRLMKMCSDDKSVCSSGTLKPEEYMEMSSEVLSAHDYENICAVNIARERWGLRSWEGYTDIETFLHDDSTVRDRRRDTLTSTVTGTSASSEISSSDTASSPPLIPNRRPRPLRSRQDDYLDTLIYDLVDCDKRRVHILDASDEHEVESNVFIAKPYVVDQHGMFFPLGSTLEPIEELEEPILTPDKVDHIMRKPRSSLVATIDEIRRGTDTDSPRNVYHRTEHVWDDDVQQTVKNIPDVKRVSPVSKNVVKSLWNDNSNSLTIDIKIVEKINSPPKLPAKVNNKLTNDSSNQETIEKLNIDIFKTSPLNAQKQKTERTNNTLLQGNGNSDENRKTSKIGNKPRRKFSLLREKFEPKCKENDEILTSSSMEMGSTVNLIDDLKSAKFTTPVITKVVQWNNVIRSQDKNTVALCEGQLSISDQESSVTSIPDRSPLSSLQDKRNVFLKQVLSPPKFNNRSKRQSFSSKDFNSK